MSRRYPTPRLPGSWGGPADLGARIHVARDDGDLCVAVEVTDDRHCNTQSGPAIGDGDALQIGIATREGHRTFGVAATADGVRVHQWQPDDTKLLEVLDCAVVRDDAKGATRYELRLDLTYTLSEAQGGKVLLKKTKPVFITADATDQPYSGIAAQQDSQARAASEAAALIRVDVALAISEATAGQ